MDALHAAVEDRRRTDSAAAHRFFDNVPFFEIMYPDIVLAGIVRSDIVHLATAASVRADGETGATDASKAPP
ncbi:hypothetical protein [Marilutibacter chinensis]|uniref:Uncharacterized protein n=1 Tax=Marilutibacter chinensis TaxID=2912247 RepID=A0ABS9HRU5_9GAMM|nr:hypothetical protein [Lysobacter chinensis]MCF7221656.1 hypothetical protein [Lysobacter chinensis]